MTTTTSAIGKTKSVGGFVSALVALLLVAGCFGGGAEQRQGVSQEQTQEQTQEQSGPPVTGNFVGKAPEEEAFVAIVAANPEEEGKERNVRAYLCDGERLSEWFTGRAYGNELNFISEGGARLEGNLSTEASSGTITLEDNRTITYTADLATGIAGLYNVTVSDGGQVYGTSKTGELLEGQMADEPLEEPLEKEGAYLITGTITSRDGQAQDFRVLSASGPTENEYRYVVLEDGQIRGARKGRSTGSYIDPVTNY